MTDQTQPGATAMEDEDEISLLDLATALGEEKKTLFAIPLITTLVAVVVSLLMTPIYTAKTVVMPPQQQQGGAAAAALASLGGLAGLAGLGGGGGLKSQDEMYIAFLGSEGLQNRLIAELKLQERYEAKTLTDTRAALKGQVRITSDKKSGLLNIEADDKDPVFAAELANRHVEALHAMLGRLAVTEAQQRRVFYEQQIQQTQDKLALVEVAFRAAKDKSGMQVTAVLAETGVRASAELRSQIAVREVQLQAMSRFATAQNPETQRIASELAAMRAQLSKTEQGSGESRIAASPLQQEAVRSYRDVKVQEAMLEVLIRQYELARVDEAKEGPLIQQVDVATPPERRSKPKRTIMVLVAGFAGLFLGVLVAFVRRALRKAKSNPESAGQWQALKKAWSLRG